MNQWDQFWGDHMARQVTIVIPCFNYGRFLDQCVTSALYQTGVDLRVIIINDASTDNSAEVAAKYAEIDSRVELISLPKNVGMVNAINYGIQRASGAYLVKLDADDLLPPGSLERSILLLEQYPNVGFVYGRPRHFTGMKAPKPRFGVPRWTIWMGAEWFSRRYQTGVNCISQPEVVIRASSLRDAGGYFNPNLPQTSDMEMWLRLATVSDVGRINGIDQGYYRVHSESMQRTVNAGVMKSLVGRREAFINGLSAAAGRILDLPELDKRFRKKMAGEALDEACRAYDRDCVDARLQGELIEFALATYPAAASLREWTRLQKVSKSGRRSRWAPRSLLAATIRRSRWEFDRWRWIRTGV